MANLHTEFVKVNIDYNTIPEIDQLIRTYIDNNNTCVYDDIITDDNRWQVFYHLSELRTGIISWFNFKPDAKVLEIGAGFGAITGTLCKKCRHVTVTEKSLFRAESIAKRYERFDNLDIYAGNFEDTQLKQKYDYIVLIGFLENLGGGTSDKKIYAEYLRKIKDMLNSDGKILLAVENRFGLRYFCGATEPHTNRAFDGINGYPKGTSGCSFSKQELEEILELAGLKDVKFYYPLPDYKLTQLVYTDSYLPEKNLKERLIPYYLRNDTLVASENELYDDIVKNNVFPFFSNSYFVECSLDGTFCNISYAAITTDRGLYGSYTTTIHEDGFVRKMPLYQNGEENAKHLYENILDLQSRGIPVAIHTWKNGGLELPFINQETLSNYIKGIFENKIEEVIEILDHLYAFILNSSEEVTSIENALIEHIENEKGTDPSGLDWGPILRKAYIELIPLNCFYEKGKFLFFDQEFVRRNYPAKYILFRAIHYIYCFTPNAERIFPKKYFIEKYKMVETWDYFMKEETLFLDEVRNHQLYKQFYKWSRLDKKRILDNAKRLESEEEIIANYKISEKMKKIWKVELQMLDEVDSICKKHGIQYFIIHGTLLGAVRHSGFIPWDDDLDICMMRKDFDKFLEVATFELKEPLSIHTPGTDKECFFGGIARVRNSQTTGMEAKEFGHYCNLGIWIDILPLDICTMDEVKLRKKHKKIRQWHRLLYAKIYGSDYKQFADMKPLKWNYYRFLAKFYPHKVLSSRLNSAMKMFTNEESELVAFFTGYNQPKQLNKKDFESAIYLNFENRKLPAPVGFKNYLFITHGNDYMSFPPEDERKPKHRGIFDPEQPYEVYQKKLFDIFKYSDSKQIIVFGSGMMFEDYMKKFGNKYRPTFLVDNDKSKWGKTKMGIEIRDPKAIFMVPESKRKLIVCSYYYKEIEKQLQEMKVLDYQIYIQKVEWLIQSEGQR
jgi:phosphorylcholine metabolism protein LicD/precorrin-6B methylase 2